MKFTQRNSKASKLSSAQVQQIRLLYAAGNTTQGQLARDFGMSIVQIGRIIRREVWQDLPEAVNDVTLAASADRLLRAQADVDGQARMEELIREAKDELTTGETKGDRLLAELSPEALQRAKELKGE